MRAVVQRVSRARVEVDGAVIGDDRTGHAGSGGIGKGDSDAEIDYLVEKILGLRIFADEQGKMGRALAEIDGGLLVVSQFTLLWRCQPRAPPGIRAGHAPQGGRRALR